MCIYTYIETYRYIEVDLCLNSVGSPGCELAPGRSALAPSRRPSAEDRPRAAANAGICRRAP